MVMMTWGYSKNIFIMTWGYSKNIFDYQNTHKMNNIIFEQPLTNKTPKHHAPYSRQTNISLLFFMLSMLNHNLAILFTASKEVSEKNELTTFL